MKSDRGMAKKIWGSLIVTALAVFCLFSIAGLAAVPAEEVIEGKDGWLFYDADRSISDYEGSDLFSDYQLSNIKTRLRKAKDYFDEQGIPFIIFIAPNKEHVYSEYMPDSYGEAASYTRIEQLMDSLGNEFTVVTPYQSILLAKMTWPQYDFYYRTDTHWNELGSYIGARTLMNAIGSPLPAFGSLRVMPVITAGRELAQALGKEDEAYDTDYTVRGYGSHLNTVMEYIRNDGDHLHYHTDGAPNKSMVIFGDSFSMGMSGYLGQYYRDIYLHRYTYRKSDIEEEKPSVVVYELVERALDYLLIFDILDE